MVPKTTKGSRISRRGATVDSVPQPDGSRRQKSTSKKNGAKNLVVVESPAKAKTISRILGDEYNITASLGHVRDLPKGKLGIDVDNQFTPSYAVMKSRASVVRELKKLGKEAPFIYLATDPDREGEAISWHLVNAAGWNTDSKVLRRIVFHEITEMAIKEAFEHPRDLDQNLINSQQARRILDRLVGYQLSPLLWKKVQRGLSAGRVQSVALKLVVDRERDIEAFNPREYWTIEARLSQNSTDFTATLHSQKGEKGRIAIPTGTRAEAIEKNLEGAFYKVEKIKAEQTKRRPSPPFTTSTLQQEAWRKLRFSARKTMMVAQQLYEGLPLIDKGSTGLITYMRTDSTSISVSAVAETRKFINEKFGENYLPKEPRVYKTKSKRAQEAHEAIRPTSIYRTPEDVANSLTKDQHRIYELIWRRLVASQMADAIYASTTVDIEATCPKSDDIYAFRATGSQPKFLGFVTLYQESKDEAPEDGATSPLPKMDAGDILGFLGLDPKQHFTKPPPRYTEASLVKFLEEGGIGRPSTYAPILSTLVDRNYVLKDQGRLKPTMLGIQVSDLLTEFFPSVMDMNFTAHMEDELDDIANGERQWVPMLETFYFPFKETLDEAQEKMPRVKVEEPTDELCTQCNSPMVIKTGRFGRFMACSTFPECRNTKPILKRTGVLCPKCKGDLVERRSKGKKRLFYGCATYPNCTFSIVQRPLTAPCPECEGLMVTKGRNGASCTVCAWQGEPEQNNSDENEV